MLGAVVILYLIFLIYPRVIRYKDFGILIPSGYSVHGIDVSHYQEEISWKEVAAMKSQGMQLNFAFIKATEGVSLLDPKFKRNWRNIGKTEMYRGAYHFFRANVDPIAQARTFLRHTHFQSGDLFPVVDVEELDGVEPEIMRQRLMQMLKYIERKEGVKPIIYTSVSFYKSYLGSEFEKYPLWVAHYTSSSQPRTEADWSFWQFSENGRVNSIRNKVDFNVFNGSLSDLEELCFD